MRDTGMSSRGLWASAMAASLISAGSASVGFSGRDYPVRDREPPKVLRHVAIAKAKKKAAHKNARKARRRNSQ